MQRIEFEVKSGERIEVHEVDNVNKNVFVCPAQDFDDGPWKSGKKIKRYKVIVDYDVTPIMEEVEDGKGNSA